ncbi:RHS repeat domain-containing protein [Aquimarina celericrescens]|uniref:RHS repeat domain-containing protein n=1 Tax=Aquimarina celericrescens TaxID=1964542 RepID=A0ABW5AQA3_9FLAO|nr:hypothetical protein [Aquimarina celericrescens]
MSVTSPITVYGVPVSDRTKTLSTGSKVKVLGTSYWTTTATYYDNKARVIYVASTNEYLNTSDIVENKLDFVDKIERTKTTHRKGNNTPIITEDIFEYDHMGRQLKQTQIINGQEEIIAENRYDELGRLESKVTGGGLQTIDYTYNIRGWMTQINDPLNLGKDLFSFGVHYSQPTHGATALYNGNIAETEWRTANDNVLRWYSYRYDALDRITGAISNDGKYDLSLVEYDKIGNITKLQRKGHLNEAATSFGMMDNLTYTYHSGGNKLKAVVDAITQPFGFAKKSTAVANNQYSYDLNGNMITDPNKGITAINYNHLNLPQAVTINNNTNSGNIQYVYDATGAKLRKTSTEGNATVTTDYAGNYIYKNGILEFFNYAEGYIEPNTSNGFDHIYQFKDHLGNIRLSYADNDNDGKIDIVRNNADLDGDNDYAHEIREEKNYYPHGLVQKGYNYTIRGRKHSYGFGGKEENEELGLSWIDFTARNYDASIGRWMNIDPLAEDMRRYSPYNYAFNNPIYYIDPDGMSPFDNYTIYSDGSILRQKTDDETDTFTYVDEGGTSHEIGTYDKNENGLIQLEDINYSMGDTEVKVTTKPGNGYRLYVSGKSLSSLIGASADSGEEIYVVSASKSDGSSPPPSTSHKNGKNIDIRYAGNNGSRDAIDYEDSKTNFDKIDQTASASMNAGLKKFGWKDIKSSKLTVTNTTTTGADGKEVTETTSTTYKVSGTKHLKNHYNHEHLQGYKPNVTTRNLQTPISLQSLPPVQLYNQ